MRAARAGEIHPLSTDLPSCRHSPAVIVLVPNWHSPFRGRPDFGWTKEPLPQPQQRSLLKREEGRYLLSGLKSSGGGYAGLITHGSRPRQIRKFPPFVRLFETCSGSRYVVHASPYIVIYVSNRSPNHNITSQSDPCLPNQDKALSTV